MTSTALVLSGGGVAGIAWETGVLVGIADAEPALAARRFNADLVIGSSAGAVVAAQLSSPDKALPPLHSPTRLCNNRTRHSFRRGVVSEVSN